MGSKLVLMHQKALLQAQNGIHVGMKESGQRQTSCACICHHPVLHTLKFAIAQHLIQHPAVSLLHLEATNVILE